MKPGNMGEGGFSLIEVVVALGLLTFCVVALLGLFSVGLRSNSASSEETTVASLLTAIASDLSATPVTTPPTAQVSPQFRIPVPAGGQATHTLFFRSDGSLAGVVDADAVASSAPRYRATIAIAAPAKTTSKGATSVSIRLTWPALADPGASTAPIHYTGTIETVAAFSRN